MTTPRTVLCPNKHAGKRTNNVRVKEKRRLIGAKKRKINQLIGPIYCKEKIICLSSQTD